MLKEERRWPRRIRIGSEDAKSSSDESVSSDVSWQALSGEEKDKGNRGGKR